MRIFVSPRQASSIELLEEPSLHNLEGALEHLGPARESLELILILLPLFGLASFLPPLGVTVEDVTHLLTSLKLLRLLIYIW